jgi:hypothetical protein
MVRGALTCCALLILSAHTASCDSSGGSTTPSDAGASSPGSTESDAAPLRPSSENSDETETGAGGETLSSDGGGSGSGSDFSAASSFSSEGTSRDDDAGATSLGGASSASASNGGGGAGGGNTSSSGNSTPDSGDAATTTEPADAGLVALPAGQPCEQDSNCESTNCRLAPDAQRYCVAAGEDCSSNAGDGLAIGEKTCDTGASMTCSERDAFTTATCDSAAPCMVASCAEETGECTTAPGNPGALCSGVAPGACDNGTCVPLRFSPPDPHDWSHVGDGPVENQPPGCGSAEMPCATGDFEFVWPSDSGQTKCYDDSVEISCPGTAGAEACASTPFCGQDAQYGVDLTRAEWSLNRFTSSGNAGAEVITDAITGALWEPTAVAGLQLPWSTAQEHCAALSSAAYAGRTNWQLPSNYEGFTLFNFDKYVADEGASDFPALSVDYLWTRNPVVEFPGYGWFLSMGVPYNAPADLSGTEIAGTYTARCISLSAQPDIASARYFVATPLANQAVVFDSRTALMWTQNHLTTATTWSASLQACESLEWAGSSDWRVPNAMELRSIIDFSRRGPAVDPAVFPSTSEEFFWTSTTATSDNTRAWTVRFSDGVLALYSALKTTDNHPVRCVRSGPS